MGVGAEIGVWVWGGDRRWAWDVEIALRHVFPAFGSVMGDCLVVVVAARSAWLWVIF